jgi:aldoxime dehydratase
MTTEAPALESAVATHLDKPGDHGPKHKRGTYNPPYPAPVARFDPKVATVVMAYYGIQHVDPSLPLAARALDELTADFARTDGPGFWDRARYVDTAGYTNTISVAYWDDTAVFDRWQAVYGADWTAVGRLDPSVGYFAEIIRPDVTRFETLFSSWGRPEGIASISDHESGPIEEHAYWGAARDRIPAGHYDPMSRGGELTLTVDGPLRTVTGHDNVCLIRSGQDITDTLDVERTFYLENVEPVLVAGMDFLTEEGTTIGCYTNRLVTVLDDEGTPIEKTFGLSWWADLRALENWSSEHPTHVDIFGAAMRHLSTFGPETKLRLYHEITVVRAEEQSFLYLNCHDGTGLLNAVTR